MLESCQKVHEMRIIMFQSLENIYLVCKVVWVP